MFFFGQEKAGFIQILHTKKSIIYFFGSFRFVTFFWNIDAKSKQK